MLMMTPQLKNILSEVSFIHKKIVYRFKKYSEDAKQNYLKKFTTNNSSYILSLPVLLTNISDMIFQIFSVQNILILVVLYPLTFIFGLRVLIILNV